MRILITADLHYENPRSRPSARAVAARICGEGGDVLILGGDTFAVDLSILKECLALFDDFRGTKLLVVGNHCLWVLEEGDSFRRYTEEIPEVAEKAGWHVLDRSPVVIGSVGFVGSVGWYDYKFRDPNLKVPERFYAAKIGPGTARFLERYFPLLENQSDLLPWHFSIRSRWMDSEYIRWRFTDQEFAAYTAQRLEAHLKQIAPHVETIVAVTHHVPLEEMVRRKENDPSWNFANAFQGSPLLGEVLKKEAKVKYIVCGHVHKPQELQLDGRRAWNVGSGIRRKRIVLIDTEKPDGRLLD